MTRFSYSLAENMPGILVPRLALTLKYGGRSIEVSGLLDTGASVNVLPYRLGLELGAIWSDELRSVPHGV